MQYLLFLFNVHAVVQFPANMSPTKTHTKIPMKTQVPPIQPKSNKNPDLDSNAEEESTTKRVTWDNSRDGLLIELLLVGLQQGIKRDLGFKITVLRTPQSNSIFVSKLLQSSKDLNFKHVTTQYSLCVTSLTLIVVA